MFDFTAAVAGLYGRFAHPGLFEGGGTPSDRGPRTLLRRTNPCCGNTLSIRLRPGRGERSETRRRNADPQVGGTW